MSVKLVEVWRGGLIESLHFGDVAVVNSHGDVVYSVGDPQTVTYWRSAAKPVQAIPIVESGAADRFGFTEQEIAIMTASHNGEEIHTTTVESILRKIGLKATALQCGIHEPYYKPEAKALANEGRQPTVLHCNCSGKHSAMLALAVFRSCETEGYLRPDHPVQQEILQVVSDFSGVEKDRITLGVDGCGVPVFGLPIVNMALAYARMAVPNRWEPLRREAVMRIRLAMTRHPHCVAGTDRVCTDLMRVADGKVIAKSGAEGVYCLALPELGLGVALKIADGASRASGPVALEVLAQLQVLTAEQEESLRKHHFPAIKNNRGEVVGEMRPAFKLCSTKQSGVSE